jgi:hypothetical protein
MDQYEGATPAAFKSLMPSSFVIGDSPCKKAARRCAERRAKLIWLVAGLVATRNPARITILCALSAQLSRGKTGITHKFGTVKLYYSLSAQLSNQPLFSRINGHFSARQY